MRSFTYGSARPLASIGGRLAARMTVWGRRGRENKTTSQTHTPSLLPLMHTHSLTHTPAPFSYTHFQCAVREKIMYLTHSHAHPSPSYTHSLTHSHPCPLLTHSLPMCSLTCSSSRSSERIVISRRPRVSLTCFPQFLGTIS